MQKRVKYIKENLYTTGNNESNITFYKKRQTKLLF